MSFISRPQHHKTIITAHICGPKIPAIDLQIPSRSRTATVSVNNEEETAIVTVPMMPVDDCSLVIKGVLTTFLIQPDRDPFLCRSDASNIVDWGFQVELDGDGRVKRVFGIRIFFKNPKQSCNWKSTLLASFFYGPRVLVQPGLGEILPGQHISYPYDRYPNKNTTNRIRIGEDLTVSWTWDHIPSTAIQTKYYRGFNITGGKILEILHNTLDELETDRFYRVSIEHMTAVVQASDYYPYAVDDWVTICFPTDQDDYQPGEWEIEPYFGRRQDGTRAGPGWFGPIAMTNDSGNYITEMPAWAFEVETPDDLFLVPLVNPDLTQAELDWLAAGNDVYQPTPIAETIISKAEKFAADQLKAKRAYFKEYDLQASGYIIPLKAWS